LSTKSGVVSVVIFDLALHHKTSANFISLFSLKSVKAFIFVPTFHNF
jgi:hypothetical protein